MKISRLMSTQHPDNVTSPFFAQNSVIAGDDEIKEAFYVFSHLNIDEQLWDAEGKEVDTFVIEKLLSRYPSFFKKSILGKDKFLTLRVPNPDVEKAQGKILLESLSSIPRHFDLGRTFYQKDIAPVFEVTIPMCFSDKNITRVHQYYHKHIIERQHLPILKKDIKISEWLGKFQPNEIRVTPLFETKDAIINSAKYVEKYIKAEKIQNLQRVWFARSDPALNYGSSAAVLINKIGFFRLYELQEKLSIDVLPIIGCGSAPFRGNLKPTNVREMVKAYPSLQTFTVQSAFKYDFPLKDVINGIEEINNTKRKKPVDIDAKEAITYINKMERDYVSSIKLLAPTIGIMSKYVPQRRKRKLHIGLFGYSRSTKGIILPRAIKFCASLYSLGLPPEILGLSTMTEKEIDNMRAYYPSIDRDLADAFQFFNKKSLNYFPKEIQKKALKVTSMFDFEVSKEHEQTTTQILADLKRQDDPSVLDGVIKAGHIRQFLG